MSSLETSLDSQKKKTRNLEDDLEESESARESLKNDISELNEKIVVLEEEVYESKTIQLDLLDQLKVMEDKLITAEAKIIELLDLNEALEKNQAIYIAKKNDKVDRCLSNYLNTFPERNQMRIMFLRESEGVY